ncbi:MAG: hypothetical protein JWN98_2589 [Abditibacteriota bacterium]|nr:hypothetical protein [Abditibacteriota bacterium]
MMPFWFSLHVQRRADQCFVGTALGLSLCALSAPCVLAQQTAVRQALLQQAPPGLAARPGARSALPGANIFAATLDSLPTLPGVLASNRADAISLDVSLAEMQAEGAASAALLQWVRDGGVVFVHNDAARIFGYRTIVARQSTPRVAGQLFGRARAALPFGGHPLLWGAALSSTQANSAQANAARFNAPLNAAQANGASAARHQSTLSVRRIFYRLRPGDHLVVQHPTGVPLLRVTDLTSPAGVPLFAVALAPFGRGWAVFTPDLIEPNRGDGAAFLRNLMRLVSSASALRRSALETAQSPNELLDAAPPLPALLPQAEAAFCSVPASAVEQLADGLRDGFNPELLPALSRLCEQALNGDPTVPEFNAANGVDANGAENVADREGFAPRLVVARSEAAGLGALANIGATNEAARPAAMAMLLVWRARLELQRDNVVRARAWMETATRTAPQGAEVLLWNGAVAAGAAENITLSSRVRGEMYAQAAALWAQAIAARPLLPRAQDIAARSQSTLDALSGVPMELVREWTNSARWVAAMMAVEPPLVTLAGNRSNPIVVRHFANDPALFFAVPTATNLANNAGIFGWRADEEEILIFPTPDYYQAYRRGVGLGESVRPNPLQRFGDITGNRILMVSRNTLPVTLPSLTPGGLPRTTQLATSGPVVLGRLHAQVLVNALTEDGTMAPEWMTMGLIALSSQTTIVELPPATTTELLRRLAIAGALRAARQFDNVTGAEAQGYAELQAQRLMTFFYARFGAGSVVETLLRLGSGETIDEALLATTGLDEEQFFVAWRRAELGPRF